MIRLTGARKARWLALPQGIRVEVRPATTAVYEAMKFKAAREGRELIEQHKAVKAAGGRIEGLPDLDDDTALVAIVQMFLAQALANFAILAWEGVGDKAGKPIPVTEEAVNELIRDHPMIAEGFVGQYLSPIYGEELEGNALGPAPSGTTAAGPTTAATAPISETPAPKGGELTEGSAPIGNTLLKPSKAQPSGGS